MRIALSWVLTSLSIFGAVLNIYKRKECFIVYGITNICWFTYFIYIKEYAPSFLQLVFFLISCWGLWSWHKEGKKEVG